MGVKWTDQEQRNRMTKTDLGLAALVGASAATALVGASLYLWGPQTMTIEPCSEDGVTLYDGTCGHPDVNDFHDGYWWPPTGQDSGTIAPLQIEKP